MKKSPLHKNHKAKKKKNVSTISLGNRKARELHKGLIVKILESFKTNISTFRLKHNLFVTAGSVLYMIGLVLPFVYDDRSIESTHFKAIEIFSFGILHLSLMALICVLSIYGLFEEKNFALIFIVLILISIIEPYRNMTFVLYNIPIKQFLKIVGPGFFLIPMGFIIALTGALSLHFDDRE